ncbi:glycosyltransferase [Dactylosporangium sp. CA-233914]|uniref:glycosyltransferase n=1 Tax=Dactylosporangium sp. CA-233914 TaxID=3239934 RepID=UPI003D8CDB39
MARTIIASTPAHGHVAPLLTIAADLARRGHEVTMLTGSRFAAAVEETGARFVALPDAADYDDRNMHLKFAGRAELAPGLAQITYDVNHVFGDPVPAQLEALRAILDDFPAASIIADSLFLGAQALSLSTPRAERPTTIAIGIAPPPVSTDWDPTIFGDMQAYLTKVFASVGAELPDFILNSVLSVPDHYLQLTVPGFEYPRTDALPSFRFIGPLAPRSDPNPEVPHWWTNLRTDRPVVVVTQGTFANVDPTQLLVPTINALAGTDVTVVAATGRGGGADTLRQHLGTVPGNVILADYVSFDLLLPRASAFITNGGYGGVHTALRHGVPIVVAGMTEDKPLIAQRVEWSGAGVNLHTDRPSEAAVRDAVDTLLTQPAYCIRAIALQSEISRYDALSAIAELVDAG